jgi:hypothetical protein
MTISFEIPRNIEQELSTRGRLRSSQSTNGVLNRHVVVIEWTRRDKENRP